MDKKSQVDYGLTNRNGRKCVKSFAVINENWHMSDHKPIALNVEIDTTVTCEAILCRAENLNYDVNTEKSNLIRNNKGYNYDQLEEYIIQSKNKIDTNVTNKLLENNVRWRSTLKNYEFSQNIETFENTSILCRI